MADTGENIRAVEVAINEVIEEIKKIGKPVAAVALFSKKILIVVLWVIFFTVPFIKNKREKL